MDSWFLPCVLIQHPKASSCTQSRSCFWLMNGARYSPLLSIQPCLLGSSQDQWPPEKAVIRIHFFLLCALVHCLSSSVQCNQVNERACNEAIRCSLVLCAQHSILRSQPLAPSAGCALGWGRWRVGEWTQSAQRH